MNTVICKDYSVLGLALMSNLFCSLRCLICTLSCFSFIKEEDFKCDVPL